MSVSAPVNPNIAPQPVITPNNRQNRLWCSILAIAVIILVVGGGIILLLLQLIDISQEEDAPPPIEDLNTTFNIDMDNFSLKKGGVLISYS